MNHPEIPGLKFISPEFNHALSHRYTLAVSIEQHGFSFLIGDKDSQKVLLVAHNNTALHEDTDVVSQIESLTAVIPWLKDKYASTRILITNQKVTLVPFSLFNPAEKEHYLSFNVDLEPEDLVFHTPVHAIKANCIFAIPGKLHFRLSAIFNEPQFYHLAAISINRPSSKLSLKEGNNHCYLHFSGNAFYLHIMRNQELAFFNVFMYNNPEEFIYYILSIASKTSISSDKTDFIISGNIDSNSAVIQQLKSAFPNIVFAVPPAKLNLETKSYDIPWHKHYDLLNLFSCEL